MQTKFDVGYLKEATDFLLKIDFKARKKILYNIEKAKGLNDPKLFKKLNDNVWEFRTLCNGKQYRLLAFWDKINEVDTFVIATHGFIKKASKVSSNEIEKAEKIRKLYFEEKE
jgi:phage-related protein